MDTKNGAGIEVPAAARPLHISKPKPLSRTTSQSSGGGSRTSKAPQRSSRTAIPAQWITSPNPRIDWRYSTSPEARARMRQYNKEYFRTRIWEPALRRDLLGSYVLATEHWQDENDARRNSYVMAEIERGERDRREMVQKKVRVISTKSERRKSGVSVTTIRETRRSGDSRVAKVPSEAPPVPRPSSRQKEANQTSTRNRTAHRETNAHVRIALEKLENRSPTKPTVSLLRTPPVPLIQLPSAVPVTKVGILKTSHANTKVSNASEQPPKQKPSETRNSESKVKVIPGVIDIRREQPPEDGVILLKYSSTPMIDAENMAFAEFGTKARTPHYILKSKMVLDMTKGAVNIPNFVTNQTGNSNESDNHGVGCHAFDSLIKTILQKKVAPRTIPPVIQGTTKADGETEADLIGIAR